MSLISTDFLLVPIYVDDIIFGGSSHALLLSLTTPALHSLHSICSGGVSVSGGILGLSLDVCMCQQGGEV